MKLCCKCKKHVGKQRAHAIAKTNIMWVQNNNSIRPHIGIRASAIKGHMQHSCTRKVVWRARRTSTFEKNMPFASQGRIFLKHHFSKEEKGNRDVVNHMPWRTATRHCVNSVMPSCITPSVISIALALL